MSESRSELRQKLRKIALEHKEDLQPKVLEAGKDYIPPTGKLVGIEEFQGLLEASVDMWLTTGRFADEFEKRFAETWGVKKALLVNSGSSANLVALSALCSPKLGERQLRPGDEFITPACGFPTTVAPAIQYGLKPIFIDVDPSTHNLRPEDVESAWTPKTKLVMAAHALGNPYRSDLVSETCKKNGAWFVEDCCDALGAEVMSQPVGSFADFSTCSFYPAHHITMGEGGAVLSSKMLLYKIAMSMRDWGRDCWCPPAISDSCKKRFGWTLGDLPEGYDHKYIYSHLGYNLKSTDFQAAIGLAQLERLGTFIEKRRANHNYLRSSLLEMGLDEDFILPTETPHTKASWFGFFVTYRDGKHQRRKKTVEYLESKLIGTRLLFGGNLCKQPAMKNVEYTIHQNLKITDQIMNDGFWIGIWPGLEKTHLDYMMDHLKFAVKL